MADEKTPAGGDDSRIIYLDSTGRETTSDEAEAAEIIELAGGVEIRRTYLDKTGATTPQWTPPGGAVTEPDVVDPTKNTWDVYVNDGGEFRLAETLDDLLAAVGWDRLPVQEAEQQLRH